MEYACNGDNSRVPLLLDLMSAQEVQDFMQVGPFIRQGKFTATIMEVKVVFIIC